MPREFLEGQVEHPGFSGDGLNAGSKKYIIRMMSERRISHRVIYLLSTMSSAQSEHILASGSSHTMFFGRLYMK
jgi:hypothetical protein